MAMGGKVKETEVAISPRTANVGAFVLFGISLVLLGIPFSQLYSLSAFVWAWKTFLSDYPVLLASLLGGMLCHELLHAVPWSFACRNGWRSIKFGFNARQLAPFVHCSEYLPKSVYALGVALPGLVLGLVPAVTSLITGSGYLLCFGVFFIAGAAGDLLSLRQLRLFSSTVLVKDHPDHLGFMVRMRDE